MAAILPFPRTISDLEDQRRRLESIDPAKTAALLDALARQIVETQKSIDGGKIAKPKRTVANRAVRTIASLRSTLRGWYNFHNLYDPTFSWWNKKPYEAVEDALQKYSTYVVSKLVGIAPDDRTTIIGDPIGREALIEELQFEMIPYTPEELVQIANKEFDWCIAEFKKASREMGFGDDYMKAIEAVKQKYVEPGKQPALIRDLAREAIDYVKKNDLVTVPRVARGNVADGDDDARTPACRTILPRRRNDTRLLSDRQYDARAEDDVDAGQQSAFCPCGHAS